MHSDLLNFQNFRTSLSGWLTIARQDKLKFLTGLTRFIGLVVENPVNLVNPVKETL